VRYVDRVFTFDELAETFPNDGTSLVAQLMAKHRVLTAEIRRRDGETCATCRKWQHEKGDEWGCCPTLSYEMTQAMFGCRAWQKREGE
jgi:hypothetical protein